MTTRRKYEIFKNSGAGDLSNNWRRESETPTIHDDFFQDNVPRVRTQHSFGMILYAKTDNPTTRWYLGVRRCFTIGFEDMVRSRFTESVIPQLLEDMTVSEREEITCMLLCIRSNINDDPKVAENAHQVLWNRIYHPECAPEIAETIRKDAFASIAKLATGGWKMWNSTLKNAMQKTKWFRPALEFPKGRKDGKIESEKSCREREVKEETHLEFGRDYEYHPHIYPLHETFLGMNKLLYKYSYAVSQVKTSSIFHPNALLKTWKSLGDVDQAPEILEFNLGDGNFDLHQKYEIGSIAWYSESVLVDEIRATHIYRRDIVRRIEKLLQQKG